MSQMNVGQVCRALILKYDSENVKVTNEELATKVVELFKKHDVAVKTSASCIAWYKNDMKKKGIILKKSQVKSIEIDLDTIE